MQIFTAIALGIIKPDRQQYSLNDLTPAPPLFAKPCERLHRIGAVSRCDEEVFNSKGHLLATSLYLHPDCPSNLCVLLLHSSKGSRIDFSTCIRQILQAKLNVCAFDFAGCGQSEGNGISFGLNESRDIESVVCAIGQKYGMNQFILWGKEIGSTAAVLYTNQNPLEVTGLILEDPILSLADLLKENISKKSGMPSHLLSSALGVLQPKIRKEIGVTLQDCELSNKIANLSAIPALFIASTEHPIVPTSQVSNLYNIYPSLSKKIVTIKHERKPEDSFFSDEILPFIDRNLLGNERLHLRKTDFLKFQQGGEGGERGFRFQFVEKATSPLKLQKASNPSLLLKNKSSEEIRAQTSMDKNALRGSLNHQGRQGPDIVQSPNVKKAPVTINRLQMESAHLPDFLKKDKLKEKDRMRISLSSGQQHIRKMVSARMGQMERLSIRSTIDPAGLKNIRNTESIDENIEHDEEWRLERTEENAANEEKVRNSSSTASGSRYPHVKEALRVIYEDQDILEGTLEPSSRKISTHIPSKCLSREKTGSKQQLGDRITLIKGINNREKYSISSHLLEKSESHTLRNFKFQKNLHRKKDDEKLFGKHPAPNVKENEPTHNQHRPYSTAKKTFAGLIEIVEIREM